jgi:hypothetical protein
MSLPRNFCDSLPSAKRDSLARCHAWQAHCIVQRFTSLFFKDFLRPSILVSFWINSHWTVATFTGLTASLHSRLRSQCEFSFDGHGRQEFLNADSRLSVSSMISGEPGRGSLSSRRVDYILPQMHDKRVSRGRERVSRDRTWTAERKANG